jgi:hypothetical protein
MIDLVIDRQLTEETHGGQLPLHASAKMTARLMPQIGLEVEAMEYLGCSHFGRGERQRAGWRNGHEPKAIASAVG